MYEGGHDVFELLCGNVCLTACKLFESLWHEGICLVFSSLAKIGEVFGKRSIGKLAANFDDDNECVEKSVLNILLEFALAVRGFLAFVNLLMLAITIFFGHMQY